MFNLQFRANGAKGHRIGVSGSAQAWNAGPKDTMCDKVREERKALENVLFHLGRGSSRPKTTVFGVGQRFSEVLEQLAGISGLILGDQRLVFAERGFCGGGVIVDGLNEGEVEENVRK